MTALSMAAIAAATVAGIAAGVAFSEPKELREEWLCFFGICSGAALAFLVIEWAIR